MPTSATYCTRLLTYTFVATITVPVMEMIEVVSSMLSE